MLPEPAALQSRPASARAPERALRAYIIAAAQWRVTDETNLFCGLALRKRPRRAARSSNKRLHSGSDPVWRGSALFASSAQLAPFEGDPTASSGEYTVRLKIPAAYKIAPHWHPKRENVAVIAGDFEGNC